MKIYLSHPRKMDFVSDLYRPIKDSILSKKNEFIFPYDRGLTFNSLEAIKSSDLVIAEVSMPSTGQGIELGWANVFWKKIICIYKEGAELSGSLKYVSDNFFLYKDSHDVVASIERFV